MINLKKIIILFSLVLILYLVYNQSEVEAITIPDSAIRLRVIPSSNSAYDLNMKAKVKDYLEENVYPLLKDTKTIEEAQLIISNHLETINQDITTIFEDNNYDQDFTINFGNNYFPNKTYKSVVYPEGYYQSLVVYIGEASGDNWWCVLFPPLCLLEADDSEETSDVEYTFWVKEIISQIF